MQKFAAFDIDGTLIRWQLYHSITNKLAEAGMLGPDVYEQIKQARLRWKRREASDGFVQYEQTILHAYENALNQIKATDFDSFIRDVIEEHKDQVYTYTRDLIKKLKAQGYFLIAISGSHHELVEQIAQYYKFDDFIGTQYERSNNSFTGKKHAPSMNKELALNTFIKKHNLIFKDSFAVGDSFSDSHMLSVVENPIVFNPDKNLMKLARTESWKIVIERKNVIYELEPVDGRYVLA